MRASPSGACDVQGQHVEESQQENQRFRGPLLVAKVHVNFPVRLHGVSPLALRTDIQRLLADCNARLESIRLALRLDGPSMGCATR